MATAPTRRDETASSVTGCRDRDERAGLGRGRDERAGLGRGRSSEDYELCTGPASEVVDVDRRMNSTFGVEGRTGNSVDGVIA
ncbi:hypothetical protein [Nesterenkonia sandarakina]|uniref:hypothetical protein n=1 Tax=Nesterenkonia sandarakina TaxID=272918 RepID=UPI0015E6C377|nr:hypothetical protein [Nesterenkonia sandarakina]